MILIKNLLTTDYGLLSLGVIVGVLVIGWWLSRWFQQNMERDAANEASRNKIVAGSRAVARAARFTTPGRRWPVLPGA